MKWIITVRACYQFNAMVTRPDKVMLTNVDFWLGYYMGTYPHYQLQANHRLFFRLNIARAILDISIHLNLKLKYAIRKPLNKDTKKFIPKIMRWQTLDVKIPRNTWVILQSRFNMFDLHRTFPHLKQFNTITATNLFVPFRILEKLGFRVRVLCDHPTCL